MFPGARTQAYHKHIDFGTTCQYRHPDSPYGGGWLFYTWIPVVPTFIPMPMELHITRAGPEDASDIVNLLNRSYRGESSRRGWTTEADLIGGDVRTDFEDVSRVLRLKGSVFLVCRDGSGRLTGCVNLQERDEGLYLGMFAVEPELQGEGIGSALMAASERHAILNGSDRIFMWVISVRHELISWYRRIGFRDTDVRMEFKEDGLSGPHLRPLEFIVLEKEVGAKEGG